MPMAMWQAIASWQVGADEWFGMSSLTPSPSPMASATKGANVLWTFGERTERSRARLTKCKIAYQQKVYIR